VSADWVIEKGVPIPPKRKALKRTPRNGRYAGLIAKMKQMEIDDSIFIDDARGGIGTANAVQGYFGKDSGMRFVRRVLPIGAGLWRVS